MSLSLDPTNVSWPDRLWNLLVGSSTKTELAARSAAKSITGGRKENQDRCYRNDHVALYLVVDGMGGHRGGSVASQIASETIPDQLQQALANGNANPESLQFAFQDALEVARREMASAAISNPDFYQMGCTLAVAVVVGDRLFYTNIGDSRVYLFHNRKIKRLTSDESLVQELLDANLISEQEAPKHRWRHVVTNFLGTQGVQKTPRWHEVKLHNGDEILLTSDGLTDELSDYEISQQLKQSANPNGCVESLLRAAELREAHDNVTCVIAKLAPHSPKIRQ